MARIQHVSLDEIVSYFDELKAIARPSILSIR